MNNMLFYFSLHQVATEQLPKETDNIKEQQILSLAQSDSVSPY